jgi:hypothetical protein
VRRCQEYFKLGTNEPKGETGNLRIRRVFSLIAFGIIAFSLSGCGDSYELQSISLEPTHPNVVGLGGTSRLVVTAHYSNNKTFDVTRKATYQLTSPGYTAAPLSAVTIDANGLIEAVGGACTWTWTGTSPNFEYGTSPYNLTVTFEGKTVQGFVSVTSVAGCYSPDTPPTT